VYEWWLVSINVNVNSRFIQCITAKPLMHCVLSRMRTKKFSGHDKNCPQNEMDHEDSLVASSRPLGRPQKRPDDRTSKDGVAARAANGNVRGVDATVFHALWCLVLQTLVNRCTQQRNVKPVQLVVQ